MAEMPTYDFSKLTKVFEDVGQQLQDNLVANGVISATTTEREKSLSRLLKTSRQREANLRTEFYRSTAGERRLKDELSSAEEARDQLTSALREMQVDRNRLAEQLHLEKSRTSTQFDQLVSRNRRLADKDKEIMVLRNQNAALLRDREQEARMIDRLAKRIKVLTDERDLAASGVEQLMAERDDLRKVIETLQAEKYRANREDQDKPLDLGKVRTVTFELLDVSQEALDLLMGGTVRSPEDGAGVQQEHSCTAQGCAGADDDTYARDHDAPAVYPQGRNADGEDVRGESAAEQEASPDSTISDRTPLLGLATTKQLLDEIATRVEVHGPGLHYRTVDER